MNNKCILCIFQLVVCTGIVLGLTGGCSHNKIKGNLKLASFHLETSPNIPIPYSEQIKMAGRGKVVHVESKACLNEYDIVNVELVQAKANGVNVLLFLFEFTPQASRSLYYITATNQGRFLLLKINGVPISLELIRNPISTGLWLTPTQMNRKESEEVVLKLRQTTQKVFKYLKKM
jgi:hypothetical protein